MAKKMTSPFLEKKIVQAGAAGNKLGNKIFRYK